MPLHGTVCESLGLWTDAPIARDPEPAIGCRHPVCRCYQVYTLEDYGFMVFGS